MGPWPHSLMAASASDGGSAGPSAQTSLNVSGCPGVPEGRVQQTRSGSHTGMLTSAIGAVALGADRLEHQTREAREAMRVRQAGRRESMASE